VVMSFYDPSKAWSITDSERASPLNDDDSSKSLHGDIDQQLRYILMPEGVNSRSFFFSAGVCDRDGQEIKIIDGLGKRTTTTPSHWHPYSLST